ncbi:7-carboxy-7-deazaguanine synthase QueE [Betaproteobacteria bacterium SCN2]|nr:7-carboxy-7-deazaguanine synthase QueE [Betaproteobacteria bacterium SCN2]
MSPPNQLDTQLELRLTEIFFSLQGETSRTGLPTVFIRLSGCPLRCGWCDTTYSFTGGETWKIADILDTVAGFGTQYVTVTGGEPLAQKHCLVLLEALCNAGYDVSLETSGALAVAGVDPRVSRIMDIKPPGSGESDRNHWENLSVLNRNDEIKFVLADREDYEWALAVMRRDDFPREVPVLFSPVHGSLDARSLADWMLADKVGARLQIQLHKHLWGEERAR